MDRPGDHWAFLRPWCAPVCGKLHVQLDGIRVRLPSNPEDATPARLHAIRDALLLLSLVARVDPCGWKHVATEYCGIRDAGNGRTLESEAFREPRFVLDFTLFSIDGCGWFGPMLELFFAEEGLNQPPNAHQLAVAVRQITSRGATGHGGDLASQRVDARVALLIQPYLGDLEQLWGAMKALRARHGGWRFPVHLTLSGANLDCGFTLGSVTLKVHEFDLDEKVVLEDMATNGTGLTLSKVALPRWFDGFVDDDDAENACHIGQLMERLLCASGSPAERHAVVELVKFTPRPRYPTDVARACSAAAEARIASGFNLSLGLEDSTPAAMVTWMWKWVAYALFSRHARARSSITSVVLRDVVITEADADAVAEVISSSDPLRLLFSHLEDERCAEAAGMLRADTRFSLLPMHEDEDLGADAMSWILEADVCGVMLANVPGNPHLVRALLPGYGLCEVRRADVIPITDAARPTSAVTRLQLCFQRHPAAASGLGRFLVLIGSSLTHLQIRLRPGINMWMPSILRCCPSLKSLIVDEGVIETSSFVQAYEASGLEIEEIHLCVNDLAMFANELASRSSRLAKSLKRLGCRLPGRRQRGRGIEKNQLPAVAAMLSLNNTLEFLRLTVPDDVYNAGGLEGVLSFHNTPMPVTLKPFPSPCRLALLSVFTTTSHDLSDERNAKRQSTTSSKPPPTALSATLSQFPIARHVFSRIFEFAATNVPRRVYVTNFSL